jgi:RNA recognition motif-containing protein
VERIFFEKFLTKKRGMLTGNFPEEKEMQGSKLYVGNFSYAATKEDLEELFTKFGEVKEIKIIEGRGFGFVEMSSPAEAEKAKESLNGSDFKGRTLRVDEARPPRTRSFSGGGGGRGRGGGGFRRY